VGTMTLTFWTVYRSLTPDGIALVINVSRLLVDDEICNIKTPLTKIDI
jgi:hypothetical protein